MTDKLNMEGPSVGPFESQATIDRQQKQELVGRLAGVLIARRDLVNHVYGWAAIIRAVETRKQDAGLLISLDGSTDGNLTPANLNDSKRRVISYGNYKKIDLDEIIDPVANSTIEPLIV